MLDKPDKVLDFFQLKKTHPKLEFTTDSDCEVLLHLYKAHGPDFLSKVFINGMFAFILYDECNDVFVVARDPIGIIPLYIGQVIEIAAYS